MIIELSKDLNYEMERFSLHWLFLAEPDVFVAAVTETAERIRQLSLQAADSGEL